MKESSLTIRKQFIIAVLSILIIITFISGAIQLYFMNDQIVTQTNQQAEAIANNVVRGIEQTELASKTIEHQIDLKLASYANHIGDLLKGKSVEEISSEELLAIRDDLGLAGITIIQETKEKDDFVGVLSTEEKEIGFSFKQYGYYEIGKLIMSGQDPAIPFATYSDQYILILPIAQSASHSEKPEFFKYAYFHVPGTDYIINPYIQANEVYEYTENVGPAAEINELTKENDIIHEIAILNPKVFADPSLEEQLYPPIKKIEAGQFLLISDKDTEFLKQENLTKQTFNEEVNGKKTYKMFLPYEENRVIYLALDYEKMTGPLYRHSIILIVTGLVSLLILFLLAAKSFNQIYENIQKIITQLTQLEEGDLTAESTINDRSELDRLSKSTNRTVAKLNLLVTETQEQAQKTQKLSVLLEAEASQSVETMYTLSTEATIKARDQFFEITAFLDAVESVLDIYTGNEKVQEVIAQLGHIREIANEQTAATTNITITLSDLLKSLHGQSSELSEISRTLLDSLSKFKIYK